MKRFGCGFFGTFELGMKAKESASRYRKRSTELWGQSDKLANLPRNTCSDNVVLGASRSSMTDESKGKVETGRTILLGKLGVDVGSRHSSMTDESKGKVEAGRSILLSKRGVDVGSRHSSMTGESKGRSRRVAVFYSANEG